MNKREGERYNRFNRPYIEDLLFANVCAKRNQIRWREAIGFCWRRNWEPLKNSCSYSYRCRIYVGNTTCFTDDRIHIYWKNKKFTLDEHYLKEKTEYFKADNSRRIVMHLFILLQVHLFFYIIVNSQIPLKFAFLIFYDYYLRRCLVEQVRSAYFPDILVKAVPVNLNLK